jgi:3-hydroxyisobutyrate dehydrogenase-like beta-hydroxyacid dehydrogenase
MGKALAINVLQAGFDVMVYDLRPEPVQELAAMGAKAARSCADIGRHSEIIEVVVPADDNGIEQAVLGPDGVLPHLNPGAVIIVHSTMHPDTMKRIDREARQKGVDVLDATMVGGQQAVASHTQTFMVGGDPRVLERVRPVLAASGSNIFHMGGVGMGAATKAAEQIITVISVLAACEGFALAEKAGVDIEVFQQMLAVSKEEGRFLAHFDQFRSAKRPDPRPFYRGLQPILKLAYDLDVQVPGAALAQQTIPWAVGEH